ncbi:proliferating cell nuclear antigen (pcna) [Methanosalsum natronophilum]|uniref:DNA polymerase sliding clamp n=1 Tax=Methanosalsum natronophilum TaxID=768733 RepID=A0A424YXL5_9EURY|nr:proliferating cell nuclear antigen (pcna) [Methanosalsum natronophilum]MCS3923712.1 proliferating cell nuclear antigen [Methanosalsum natronophilum]RQD85187.1 MAG: proliferating cell nuclear antigen (pcna) [Methanosalsum natronophilum]
MFKATIEASLLKDSIEILSVLVDEARFKISKEGLSVKAVDPANVAMVSFNLESEAFEEFEGDDTEIGMDLTKINDIMGVAEKNDNIVLELKEETQKMEIHIGGFSYTLSLIDPSTIRSEPRIPQLDLAGQVILNGSEMRKAIKAAEKISDHIMLGIEDEIFYMEAEGDTDKVRLEMTRDQLIDMKAGDARSMFSLDYLSDIVKPASKSNEVELNIGKDFPIKINFEVANGKGIVNYLLAPRIEAE